MIFLDTSVVIAILNGESDARSLLLTLKAARRRLTSVTVRLEVCMVLSRLLDVAPARAQEIFQTFVDEAQIEEVGLPVGAGSLPVSTFNRYGKGRHPARLNFGDCLSYACARVHGARLLYKGEDFSLTDVDDFS